MNAWLNKVINKHRKRGLLVDTNILLLHCVGRFSPDRIAPFKRTQAFVASDFLLLEALWQRFDHVFTTPTVLAEVSNLIGEPTGPYGQGIFRSVASTIEVLNEHYVPSKSLASESHFMKFGLTDSAIVELAQRKVLVLTDDFRLAQYLESRNLAAINFNHLRFGQI